MSDLDMRDVPCRGCGNLSLKDPTHIYGDRKCCPDCDHRPDETWPIRAALIAVIRPHNLGAEALRIADELMPVVYRVAADTMRAQAAELRECALLNDAPWNPHRVWTWLSDRADVLDADR
jgi:hypothetical protein